MIDGKESMVDEFVLHRIGANSAESVFSDHSAVLQGPEEQEFLRKLFLRPFASMAQTLEFAPEIDGKENVLHAVCKAIETGDDLVGSSTIIANHLINASENHAIKGGDLFVVKFSHVVLGTSMYEAVGIYKFDEKEVFIESKVKGKELGMQLKRGLGTTKPNMACLVVFTKKGYTLFMIDDRSHNPSWQQDFIGHRLKRDNVNSTSSVLEMTKSFITEKLPQDFEIPKADQIDLLNRSVQYFKDNSEFDKNAFAQEVFQEESVMGSFQKFGEQFQESHGMELDDNFEISSHAVKRQARIFKTVLKLDKNFHIYIHGDRNKIEHGVDDGGRKFYKIYYELET